MTNKLENLKPFKKGYDERRNYKGRPKGSRNFRTLFLIAVRELELEKKIGDVEVALIKRGIEEALNGNFSYWKELMDRNYGKVKTQIEIEEDKRPIPILTGFIEKVRETTEERKKTE